MLEIDGGDGGGQILRSAMGLSAVTGRTVEISDIRGNRPEPGLKPQHLTAVETLAGICDATVEGADQRAAEPPSSPASTLADTTRSTSHRRQPHAGVRRGGPTRHDALLAAVGDGHGWHRCQVVAAAGDTPARQAPVVPAFRTAGRARTRANGVLPGWRRRGDTPSRALRPRPTVATDRGSLRGARIYSRDAADLSEDGVARRQAQAAEAQLAAADIDVVESVAATAATASPGCALTLV